MSIRLQADYSGLEPDTDRTHAFIESRRVLKERLKDFGLRATVRTLGDTSIQLDLPATADTTGLSYLLTTRGHLTLLHLLDRDTIIQLLERIDRAITHQTKLKYQAFEPSIRDNIHGRRPEGLEADRPVLGILTRPYHPAPYGVDDTSRTRLLKLLGGFDSARSYNLGMKVLFGRAIPIPGIRLYSVHFVDPNPALDVRRPVNAAVDKFYGKSFAEVMIQLDSTDAPAFLSITRKAIGKQIAIVIDNEVYEAPVVQGEISDGRISLSTLTSGRAQLVATVLNDGPMPVVFHALEGSR